MNIRTQNLNSNINNLQILKNINASFNNEGINVLIGPNGAGKTSLLRQVTLLDRPTSGEIFYEDRPVSRMSSDEKTLFRRKIGFVFQTPLMLSGTVFDNITYGLKIRGIVINKNKVEEALLKIGLSDKSYHNAKELSGGEKQRLSIARVLIIEPEVFIFDEPTVNLDPLSVKTIEDIISGLAGLRKTIILSTHNLRQAIKYGSKISFMKDGEILQEGDFKEIFNRPAMLDVAEYLYSKNIIYGNILKEDGQTYLIRDDLKIVVVAGNISGEVAGILSPEDIFVSKTRLDSSARNCFRGTIKNIEWLGSVYILTVCVNKVCFETVITKQSLISMNLKIGDEIFITFKATSVHILKSPLYP